MPHNAVRTPRVLAAAVLPALLAPAFLLTGPADAAGTTAPGTAAAPGTSARSTAAGGPGALSHYDLARKDCVGTSRTARSKVWFTVANGVLSDVYEPTVDTTNVETMQFVVTDGRTFTDLQTRDATYTAATDPTGMTCTITTTANSRAWRLVSTYLTDPERDTVLVSTVLRGLSVPTRNLHLFSRLDPTVGGHGGGGKDNAGADSATTDSATGALLAGDPTTATAATHRDYARPTVLALRADRPFLSSSNGYVGTVSDGLAQLDSGRRLTTRTTDAPNGNVVATAELALDEGRSTLALGFGRSGPQAVATAGASLTAGARSVRHEYERGWRNYDRGLRPPPVVLRGLSAARTARLRAAYYLSVNVVKASEDKTFPGAVVAGLASPWGQAVSAGTSQGGKAPYFGSYREVFSRDLYEAFTALLAAGDVRTARATARFLLERQQLADGRLPRNSLLNGQPAPDTGGDQLDETADPILMAYQSGLAGDAVLYRDHERKAADFLVAHGPSFGSERWEEQSGYSPSTVAAEIAGLVAAGRIAQVQGDHDRARLYLATADHFQRSVKGWTVTTSGPYAPRYFLRLSKTGDPNVGTTYGLGNGGPTVDERTVLDGGFQELTRLGILPADDPDVVATLPLLDTALRRTTPTGPGWYRYGTAAAGSEDGYGDCHVPDGTDCAVEGQPWPTTNHGSGHLWPVLAGERAEQQLQTGHRVAAAALLETMSRSASGVGLVPEQVWENDPVPGAPYGADPATASIGFAPGHPAGSAAPLTWAQAEQARLTLSLGGKRPVEQPAAVRSRYVDHPPPRRATLTVITPAAGAAVTGITTTVIGTAAPGARVVVAATNTDSGAAGSVGAATAGPAGTFSVTLPAAFGTTVLTTTATAGSTTGYDQRSVSSDVVTGTRLLDVADPVGDDHGPGTFQYPTSADFHAGAFDLTRFQVVQDGATTYLRARLADLSPTFGNALGAQLLTIFVHRPGTTGSTQPLFASRHYSVAGPDSWSRAVQVRGFDETRVYDASGGQVGTANAQASQLTGFITVPVPTALLGGPPARGWTFTVVLHGQDGFGQDGARTFTATAQPFTFGRCPTAIDADPRCAVPLDQLPKAMDVLVPPGATQAQVLDPTGPVVLRGVAIP